MRSVPYRFLTYLTLLGVSFVALGICGYSFVYKLDDSYSVIISNRLPVLNLVRSFTVVANRGRHIVDELIANPSPEALAAIRPELDRLKAQNDANFKKLDDLINEQPSQRALDNLGAERVNYRARLEKVFALVEQRASVAAVRAEYDLLTEPYNHYLASQDALAAYAERTAQVESDLVTDKTRNALRFFVLFAIWPAVIGLGLFLYGFFTTVVIFVRKK